MTTAMRKYMVRLQNHKTGEIVEQTRTSKNMWSVRDFWKRFSIKHGFRECGDPCTLTIEDCETGAISCECLR